MITFPRDVAAVLAGEGELRAGGTDLMERRRSGRSSGSLVDLRDLRDTDAIVDTGFELRIGARVPIARLAADPRTPHGLAAAAGGLATSQIRAVATVGGNLMQHVRCWYYRNPECQCLRSGGTECLSRAGDHLYHVAFDTSPCAAPHPSTLGCAFVAYDATVETWDAGGMTIRTVADLLASGARPLVTAILVPRPADGEKAAYKRAIARARAEWPLVEAVARLRMEGGVVKDARVAIGGVAPTPLRREAVENALIGARPTPDTLAAAAALATDGANPLPMTAYKVPLIAGTVLETLELAMGAS